MRKIYNVINHLKNYWLMIRKYQQLCRVLRYLLLFLLFLGFVNIRISHYGNPFLSIAAQDTNVYISGAEYSLFGGRFFSSGRPPTVPLLYKVFRPEAGYEQGIMSEPAVLGSPRDLVAQPGFDKIVFVQMMLAIICWSTLAIVMFSRLHNMVLKVLAVFLIMIFAYSPQIVEWDRILLSESVSFSLFALTLALTIEIVFYFIQTNRQFSLNTFLLVIGWLLSMTFWVFSRDTNAYTIIITIIFLILPLFITKIRKRLHIKTMMVIVIYLSILFVVQQETMHASGRWVLPFQSNLISRVFPYEDRVAFFQNLGMPVNDQLLSYNNYFDGPEYMNQSEEFAEWVHSHGSSSYMRFLMDYPLWASLEMVNDLENLFSENLQPWYSGPREVRPIGLISIGDFLHPKDKVVVPLVILLTLMVIINAVNSRKWENFAWGWVFSWLLLVESMLLFVSYHGDPRSILRHSLVAIMPMRLSIWMLLMVVFDQSINSSIIYRQFSPWRKNGARN